MAVQCEGLLPGVIVAVAEIAMSEADTAIVRNHADADKAQRGISFRIASLDLPRFTFGRRR
jgi:hypothetical protein